MFLPFKSNLGPEFVQVAANPDIAFIDISPVSNFIRFNVFLKTLLACSISFTLAYFSSLILKKIIDAVIFISNYLLLLIELQFNLF